MRTLYKKTLESDSSPYFDHLDLMFEDLDLDLCMLLNPLKPSVIIGLHFEVFSAIQA